MVSRMVSKAVQVNQLDAPEKPKRDSFLGKAFLISKLPKHYR